MNVSELFSMGNDLLTKNKYYEAFKCFQEVIATGATKYLSGCYVNMA
jgi:glycerate-2-kinase